MNTFAIVAIFTLTLAQGAISSDPLNVYKLPDRIVLYKDIVQNPVIRDAIVKYSVEKENYEPRIVGGDEVLPHSVPHQVALLIDQTYFCGGSLISTNWVLTAAHCVDGANSAVVILGAHNLYQNETTRQTLTATQFKTHPDWNPKLIVNDVGLIQLPNPVTLSESVSTVCLVPSTIHIAIGTTMITTGWGRTSDDFLSDLSPALQTVNVPTISNQKCAEVYSDGIITNGTICTDTFGGKGTCLGDSGGPLIIKGNWINGKPNPRQCQAGITSFVASIGCQQGKPAGFSRVAYFLDGFITKETGVLACNECENINVAPYTSTTIRGTSSSNINSYSLFSLISFILFFFHILSMNVLF